MKIGTYHGNGKFIISRSISYIYVFKLKGFSSVHVYQRVIQESFKKRYCSLLTVIKIQQRSEKEDVT